MDYWVIGCIALFSFLWGVWRKVFATKDFVQPNFVLPNGSVVNLHNKFVRCFNEVDARTRAYIKGGSMTPIRHPPHAQGNQNISDTYWHYHVYGKYIFENGEWVNYHYYWEGTRHPRRKAATLGPDQNDDWRRKDKAPGRSDRNTEWRKKGGSQSTSRSSSLSSSN